MTTHQENAQSFKCFYQQWWFIYLVQPAVWLYLAYLMVPVIYAQDNDYAYPQKIGFLVVYIIGVKAYNSILEFLYKFVVTKFLKGEISD